MTPSRLPRIPKHQRLRRQASRNQHHVRAASRNSGQCETIPHQMPRRSRQATDLAMRSASESAMSAAPLPLAAHCAPPSWFARPAQRNPCTSKPPVWPATLRRRLAHRPRRRLAESPSTKFAAGSTSGSISTKWSGGGATSHSADPRAHRLRRRRTQLARGAERIPQSWWSSICSGVDGASTCGANIDPAALAVVPSSPLAPTADSLHSPCSDAARTVAPARACSVVAPPDADRRSGWREPPVRTSHRLDRFLTTVRKTKAASQPS